LNDGFSFGGEYISVSLDTDDEDLIGYEAFTDSLFNIHIRYFGIL